MMQTTKKLVDDNKTETKSNKPKVERPNASLSIRTGLKAGDAASWA
jgi:hypothetical protein